MICRKTVDGFSWILDVTDGGIGRTLYSSSTKGKSFSFARECGFMQIMNQTIKEGMTCIDLGANIGYATMFMLRNAGNKGYVYAIEPDEHNLKYLKANIKENNFLDTSRVEISQCLISNHNGISSFWLSDKPNLNSINKTKHSVKEEEIICYTLEEFCKTRKYPNFIKMDIEGHEVSVFNGGYNYFKNNRGETHILLEIHPSCYNENNNFAKTLQKYFEIGFNCSYIIATPRPKPELFVKMGYEPAQIFQSDGFTRGLYKDIKNDDAIQIACRENLEPWKQGHTKKIARSIMLSRIE